MLTNLCTRIFEKKKLTNTEVKNFSPTSMIYDKWIADGTHQTST